MGILVNRPPQSPKANHVNKLLALEAAMFRDAAGFGPGSPEAEARTFHYHCEGSYVREWRMGAGETVTGAIHKFACINILLQGDIRVVQSDGETEKHQGDIWISIPGEKKAIYAFTDTRMLTVHATEETDQDKLRAHFTVPPQEFLLENQV
jgi:hypothetical protein